MNSTKWKYAARHTTNFKGEFSNINLWIDSSDFKLIEEKDRKNHHYIFYWSYNKENAPAQRYWMIVDAK